MKSFNEKKFLQEDFSVSENREYGLTGIIKEMSERTYYDLIDPEGVTIFSLLGKRSNGYFPIIKITPDVAKPKLLLPTCMDDIWFSSERKNRGRLDVKILMEQGLNTKLLDEIEEVGFFFQYNLKGNTITFVPSKCFLATLCRQLGIGKLGEGIDPMRDIYLASRMREAEEFLLVSRRGEAVRKAFSCLSPKFYHESQEIVHECRKMLKEEGNVSVRSWEVNHFLTRVDFALNDYTVQDGAKITPGVRFVLSDVGDASYSLVNTLYLNGGTVVFGNPVTRKHTGRFSIVDMTEEYRNGTLSEMRDALERLEGLKKVKVTNKLAAIKYLMKAIDFTSSMGKALVKEFRERYYPTVPEAECTMYDVVLWMLKIPGNVRLWCKDYVTNNVQQCVGKVFTLKLEGLRL